jgi:beta-phosphoglucomutase-like phosphatase (HAD superfamily)
MIERLEALIFDVDGTLAETEEVHRRAFNQAFAEAGLDWVWTEDLYRELLKVTGGKERIAHFMGRPDEQGLVRRLHARKTDIYAALMTPDAIALRPGVEALLREARRRGVALALATTTSRPNVDALIGAVLGEEALGWFASIACGDRVAAKKPAPDIYHLALAELGVPATRAVAIEDSWNGVRAARAAGLAVIATPSLYSAGDDFSEAQAVVAPDGVAAALGWL